MTGDVAALFRLDGQVALVTGAARGIGRAVAETLASAGAHVAVNDVDADALNVAVGEMRTAGLGVSAYPFSVADGEAARVAVDGIVAAQGRLDILVNNAGNQNRKPFVDYTPAEWRSIIDVHVNGAFNVTQPAVRQMKKQGGGRIVMMSSIVAQAVKGTISPYATSKGALAAMTRALATELGPDNITCNAIGPTFVRTDFTAALQGNEAFDAFIRARVPMGRWGEAGDIAPAVLVLVSPAAAFISGAYLPVDGGILASL